MAAGIEWCSLIAGKPLPAGGGKTGHVRARPQVMVLIFADADVRWSVGAVASLIEQMQQSQADLLTVWPMQETQTWSERLVVPMMAVAIIGYLPLVAVHHISSSWFAGGTGDDV